MTFIYVLRCPFSREVRYVGKGDNLKSRLRQHVYEARGTDIKTHKCDWIRSVLQRGAKPIIEVDEIVLDGACWKEAEQRRIAYYQALGCDLTNGTTGGDGNGPINEEARAKLAKLASERFGSAQARVKQSETMKSLCADTDWLAARTETQRKVRGTREWSDAQSERSKALWRDPDKRERMTEARRRLSADPDYRARISESNKRAHSCPEFRRRKSEQMKEIWARRKSSA